jgi:predicted metal-dependent hydrolase
MNRLFPWLLPPHRQPPQVGAQGPIVAKVPAGKKTQVLKRTRFITLDDHPVPLTVCRNARAKRMRLRVDFDTAGIILTLPQRTPEEHGFTFVLKQQAWILDRLGSLPPRVPFCPDALVPVLGKEHPIRHRPADRLSVRVEDGAIIVPGCVEAVPRRVDRWLRGEARRVLTERAHAKAVRLGRPVGRITVRDTRTRWGSCSSAGNLSFCWRLIMTPPHVLDYVAAHEVAHLAHRNHGPEFWQTVAVLSDDVDGARRWLLRHGPGLARYG